MRILVTYLLLSCSIALSAQFNTCGSCFHYILSEDQIHLDFSNVVPINCDGVYYQLSYYTTDDPDDEIVLEVLTELPPNLTYFIDPGDYVICLKYFCEGELNLNNPDTTLEETQNIYLDICCVAVKEGEECTEPPICHFTIDPFVVEQGGYYYSDFDASSSSNIDYYAWEWGDYSEAEVATSPYAYHGYSAVFPDIYPEVNVCLTGTNSCGMSRYCCTYYTYGDANEYYDLLCSLPFDAYDPPEIVPSLTGNAVSFDDISWFACGADVYFDPGDGSGEIPVNACNGVSYSYSDEGPYYCCLTIHFGCFSICFCFTVHPGPRFDCDSPYPLYCNEYGNDWLIDANDPALHQGFSPLTELWLGHELCDGYDDGCDAGNVIQTSLPFSAHEVTYVIENPSNSADQDIVIDLVPQETNLDVDLFVYETCYVLQQAPENETVIEDCAGSSTYPPGVPDAVFIEDAYSSQYYLVVDGGAGASNQEGEFQISVTCGDLCTKDLRGFLQCGKTLTDSTTHFTTDNQASYYCGCDNDINTTRAGNFGPENVYALQIIDTAVVTIELEILTQDADLELYLLSDCEVTSCLRNSRNGTGESEHIERTLFPGTYYVIVEGYHGDTGKYRLSVNGCQCSISCPGITPVYSENFEGLNDGDTIPQPGYFRWDHGNYVYNDPLDHSKAAVIEERDNQDNRMILNYGNYGYSDVSLRLGNDTTDVHEVAFDVTLSYVDEELYHGMFRFYEITTLLDAHQELRVRFGHDAAGKNFADLYSYWFSFGAGVDSMKLASITPFIDVGPDTLFKTFRVAVIYDIDNGYVSLEVDGQCIYLGGYWLSQTTDFLIDRRFDFIAHRAQSYMEIDDVVIGKCGTCDWIYEEDCDHIVIGGIYGDDQFMNMSFDAAGIPEEDILGWQIIDETEGDTVSLLTGDWGGFTPGHSCKVCVIYRGPDGCIRVCCIRIFIPANCTLVSSGHIGNDDELLFEFTADDNLLEPVMFVNLDEGESNTTGIFSFDSPGYYRICCVYYHPALKQYLICCRTYCIDFPWTCGPLFTYTTQPGSQGTTVIFSRNAPQSDSTYWDFGDGTFSTSSGTSVTHLYPSGTGSYYVCLTVWDPCKGYCTYCIEIFVGDPLILRADDACGPVGQVIEIPIRVENFNDLVTGAFTITLDQPGAKLVGVDNGALTQIFVGNVVNDQTATINWVDIQSNPLTLPDQTIIAVVKAEITSPLFQSATVAFSSDPVAVKFTDSNDNAVPTSTHDGSLCLAESVTISGQIKTVSNLPMPGVKVWRYGQPDLFVNTNQQGLYSVEADLGMNYTIAPEKTNGPLNGISPLDLVIILRHVAFIQRFTDPEQWLAGDVDRNGIVEILDYKILNDLLLGKITQFPGGKSWRFLPTNYQFIDPDNPLGENPPETRMYSPLTQTIANAHFTGIKLGDVNFSALPQIANDETTLEDRTACDVMAVQNAQLNSGEVIDIRLQARDFTDVLSFLVELQFDPGVLEYVGFSSSALSGFDPDQIGTGFLGEGFVHILWVDQSVTGVSLPDNDNIVALKFKVLNGGVLLSDVFDITSVHRNSEIVYNTLEGNCLELSMDGVVDTEELPAHELQMRAFPNPFSDQVSLTIVTESSERATLRVFNSLGQVVTTDFIQLHPGVTNYTVTSDQLGDATGALYVQLQSGSQSVIIPLVRMVR